MRIKLELEDFRFASTASELGNEKWLVVTFGGKQFYVRRVVDEFRRWDARYLEQLDSIMVDHMQAMIETLLQHGAAAQPEGIVELMCKGGVAWRDHYAGKCKCVAVLKKKMIVAGMHPLAPRVRAVARLLIEGMDSHLVAKELGIGYQTVRIYVTKILDATGQDSVLAATMYILKTPEALGHVMDVSLDSERDSEIAIKRWKERRAETV